MSREINNIAQYIDNTLLKPTATEKEFTDFCVASLKHGFGAVCIPPFFVRQASEILLESSINICTVIGFPLGYNPKNVKKFEIKAAMKDGAEELDIVLNQSMIQSESYDSLLMEMKEFNNIVHSKYGIVKYIVETAYLNKEQCDKVLELCLESGADYIKTSTGFAPKGAQISTVKRWNKLIGKEKMKIKASGGIKNSKEAVSFITSGADRIGCSRGITIVEEYENL
jgi:deoxyribose-phosphate aldolase